MDTHSKLWNTGRVRAALVCAIAIGCFFCSCSTQKEQPPEIRLRVIPSGGGDIGYLLAAEGTQLVATSNELDTNAYDFVLGKVVDSASLTLDDNAMAYLSLLTASIEESTTRPHEFQAKEDVWVFTLEINSRLIARFDAESLQKGDEWSSEQKLVMYLIHMSPLEIDLHSFS